MKTLDQFWMWRAMELAQKGRGWVEPNPLVGCVIVKDGDCVGEGYHERFGGNHAEVNALQQAGTAAAGATVYVTLEPCCHFGKTPPCVEALVRANVERVVVAMQDPFPKVAGGGIQQLRDAGILVELGVLENEALKLNDPYLKLQFCHRPYVTAKWAMTLDGKIASREYSSRWISGTKSRAVVHRLRSRMDAILVGAGTVLFDNPMLNVRLNDFAENAGEKETLRTPMRVIADASLQTPLTSRVVETAVRIPTLLLIGPTVSEEQKIPYLQAGCEFFRSEKTDHAEQLLDLLDELGRRQVTNLLVEGGSKVLGALWDVQEIDAVHVFIAPKLLGGSAAVTPIGGYGIGQMDSFAGLLDVEIEVLDSDIHYSGRVLHQEMNARYGQWIADG